jgi:hypothetical protein
MRGIGRTTEMWKLAVQLAREGRDVLVCVHTYSFSLHLSDIPLDDCGTTITNFARWETGRTWRFDSGGTITFQIPGQPLRGRRFDNVLFDHEAEYHFTVGDWLNEIEPSIRHPKQILDDPPRKLEEVKKADKGMMIKLITMMGIGSDEISKQTLSDMSEEELREHAVKQMRSKTVVYKE